MNNIPIRDIHLPPPPGWWPPAPGWWLLAALLLLALAVWLWRRYRPPLKSLQKTALRQLDKAARRFRQQQDKTLLLQDVSILLRRISLSCVPRRQTASLIDRAWLQQLDRLNPASQLATHFAELLSDGPYRPQVDYDAEVLIRCTRQWIETLPDWHRKEQQTHQGDGG